MGGVCFRCCRTLSRRRTASGVQILTLLLLKVFAVAWCSFWRFDDVIDAMLLRLWRLLSGHLRPGIRLMVVHRSRVSILQLRLLVDRRVSLLLRCSQRCSWLVLWLNVIGCDVLLVMDCRGGTVQVVVHVYHILVRLLLRGDSLLLLLIYYLLLLRLLLGNMVYQRCLLLLL